MLKQFAIQTIQDGMEKELHRCARETIQEGYGYMTGAILMMNFQKMQEIAIAQFKTQKK